MRRAATAESILIKFGTSTPWADVVVYLKRHPNWSKCWGGEGFEISPIPLTLPLASNTAYCATAHTRDTQVDFHFWDCNVTTRNRTHTIANVNHTPLKNLYLKIPIEKHFATSLWCTILRMSRNTNLLIVFAKLLQWGKKS